MYPISAFKLKLWNIFLILFVLLLGFFLYFLKLPPRQCKMIYWYDIPATKYWEGLPIGTGRFGAMIPGNVENEKIVFNDESLWSGQPYNPNNTEGQKIVKEIRKAVLNKNYQKADSLSMLMVSKPIYTQQYQVMGALNLLFDNQNSVHSYKRELDLDSAIVRVSYTVDNIKYKREIFASYPDQLIVIRITANKPNSISCIAWLNSRQSSAISAIDATKQIILSGTTEPAIFGLGNTPMNPIIPNGIKWEAILKTETKGGNTKEVTIPKENKTQKGIKIEKANEVIFYLAGATNYVNWKDISGNEKEKCKNYISNSEKGFTNLKQRHIDDYMPIIQRFQLFLGVNNQVKKNTTERLEDFRKGKMDPCFISEYVQFARYILLCDSRENTLAFNTHNIWTDTTNAVQNGRYTMNINMQENFWNAEIQNLSNVNQSIYAFTRDLSEAGYITAKELYGFKGWVAHHATDAWMNTAPNARKPEWCMFPLGGVWMCQLIYEHYLFNPDTSYLKQIYPILKGASEFCIDLLIKDTESNYLLTCPSTSPENKFKYLDSKNGFAVSMGSAMDIQLVRNLFRNTIQASTLLKIDKSFSDSLKIKLKSLPPHKIGKYGQLQEWFYDFEETEINHRHVSQLFAVYPDDDISPLKTPELIPAVRKVLERRGEENLGWSGAWNLNIYARLADAQMAYKWLIKTMSGVSMHERKEDSRITPSFQDNQGLQAIAAGVTEMILQSHENEIKILPALPQEWPTGWMTGIKARGGFEVDVYWEKGLLKEAFIKSNYSTICKIRTKYPVRITLKGKNIALKKENNFLVQFQTEKGNTYKITRIGN